MNELTVAKDAEINKLKEDKLSMSLTIDEITTNYESIISKLKAEDDEIKKNVKKNENLLQIIKKELVEKEDQNNILIDENETINLCLIEKNNHIHSLNEEIKILKSIIKEKDETIDSFREKIK